MYPIQILKYATHYIANNTLYCKTYNIVFIFLSIVITTNGFFIDDIILPKRIILHIYTGTTLVFLFFLSIFKKYKIKPLKRTDCFFFVTILIFILPLNEDNLNTSCYILTIGGLFLLFKQKEESDLREIMVYSLTISGIYTLWLCLKQNFYGFPITGPFDTSAGSSFILSCSASIMLVELAERKYKTLKNTGMIAFIIVSVYILLLIGARSGLFAICLTLALVIKNKIYKAFGSFVGITLIILFSFIKIDSSQGRAFIISTTFTMFDSTHNTLFGRGNKSFQQDYMMYQAKALKHQDKKITLLADNIKHPLNDFLLLALEYGIIRVLLLLVVIFYYLKRNKPNPKQKVLLYILCVFSFFSYPFKYPLAYIILCWILYPKETKDYITNKTYTGYIYGVIGSITLINGFFTLTLNRKWAQAYEFRKTGQIEESLSTYAHVAKLCNSPDFLYNYAYILSISGKKHKGLQVICKSKNHDYETTLLKAQLYHENHSYKESILQYRLAHKMCPVRFLPLYGIYKIYEETNDNRNKEIIAKEILCKEIKIPSERINRIKAEVKASYK